MSDPNKSTFIAQCLRGESLAEDIDDWVDQWHDTPQSQELHEYLGMSWDEYSAWVSMPELLPFIIIAHRENRNFRDWLEEYTSFLITPPWSHTNIDADRLAQWLAKQKIA